MQRRGRLPLWQYILMNIIVLAVLVGIYWATEVHAQKSVPPVESIGFFPILLVCYVAFVVAQVFDGVFDAIRNRQRSEEPKIKQTPLMASQEKVKKLDADRSA